MIGGGVSKMSAAAAARRRTALLSGCLIAFILCYNCVLKNKI